MKEEILIPEELVVEEETPEVVEEEAVEKDTEKEGLLTALHKERDGKRRYRDEVKQIRPIIDRLMASTGATTPEELVSKMDAIELSRRMKERGVDEDTAREILRVETENRMYKSKEAARNFDKDIQDLANDPYYSDIADVRDDVEEYAQSRGMSVKEAYNALFGEERTRKLIEQAKQDAIASNDLKASKKIAGLSQGGNASGKGGNVKLTASELEIASAAGMTPEEYYKYKNME